jgi:DNA-binding CsgD family transcriptional regulator
MAFAEGRPDSRPGVLAFTISLELLYMNQEAHELSQYLNRARGGPVAQGVLPSDVNKLCEEILSQLERHADAQDWEQVHARRTIGDLSRTIVLQGFGIPDASGLEHSLIIVLMEERHTHSDLRVEAAKDRYHLTDREMNVLEHLAKGLTNKEIAITLGIAEQTIKEHLKHIMVKTHVSTRTAVLAQLFQGEAPNAAKDGIPRGPKQPVQKLPNAVKASRAAKNGCKVPKLA